VTRRLVATYLVLAAVVLLALEIPLAVLFERTERRALEGRIERDAITLAALGEDVLEAGGPHDGLRRTVAAYSAATGARVVVVDRDGTLVADTDEARPLGRSFANRPEIDAALEGTPVVGERDSRTLGQRFVYVAVPSTSGGVVHGAVRVSFSAASVDDRVRHYRVALVGIAIVVLTVVAVVGWLLARSLVGPLDDIGETAERAGDGDLAARAPEDAGPPEVRALARRLNASTARIEALVAGQRDFLADASHQLRTPLTALRLRLENLEGDVSPRGRDGLEAAVAEADRLGRLVEGLLALARADAQERAPARVDLAAVARARVAAWSPLCEDEGVDLVDDVPDGLVALAVPGALEQVVDNLIDNALQASPRGGRVDLAATRRGYWIELVVADRGPGMASAEMARAFDRFWTTRDDDGGSGLGLAIVAHLARASGGTAALAARQGGGLEVTVRVPAAP
jgi:signal transduction histidine kinase